MLERVAQGQTRFSVPGIGCDIRGVALGRYGVVLFQALDGLVGWLRLYSDVASLDDLLPEMKILSVRTALKSRAFLLFIPTSSSHRLDQAARLARLSGGATFTGTSRHFVKYRDERAPFGYDVADRLVADASGPDHVLHADSGPMPYFNVDELGVRDLVLRLSLRRRLGWKAATGQGELILTVPPGLRGGVLRTLWRRRVPAEVALISTRTSAFALPGEESTLLIRARDFPARLLEGFRRTPGLIAYQPLFEQVAVEVGWEHPIQLSSCRTLFEKDGLVLFSGMGINTISGPIELSNARHLVDIEIQPEEPEVRQGAASPAPTVAVELKLVGSSAPLRRVMATLIPWPNAPQLKQLVYLLPPATLRNQRVASTSRGLLVVADGATDVIPLGTFLAEVAPGILVPAGMELWPRVLPDVLAQALGHGVGRRTIFPQDGGPFQVLEDALVPLERRVVAVVEVEPQDRHLPRLAEPAEPPRVTNDPVGAFALWGFSQKR